MLQLAADPGWPITLKNNLFDREFFVIEGAPQLAMHNNLFKGSFAFFFISGGDNVVRDNAFDSVVVDDESDPELTHDHNAYINTTGQLQGCPHTGDQTLSSLTYYERRCLVDI